MSLLQAASHLSSCYKVLMALLQAAAHLSCCYNAQMGSTSTCECRLFLRTKYSSFKDHPCESYIKLRLSSCYSLLTVLGSFRQCKNDATFQCKYRLINTVFQLDVRTEEFTEKLGKIQGTVSPDFRLLF
jgi:hypothetical protein